MFPFSHPYLGGWITEDCRFTEPKQGGRCLMALRSIIHLQLHASSTQGVDNVPVDKSAGNSVYSAHENKEHSCLRKDTCTIEKAG